MKALFNGKPIFGPRGPAGPDGNPIGTIINYMGVKAPKDYLVCDGTKYSIKDYSKLAEFFKEQFGSSNYFGGDGETTFATPDLRNLFLRGYHGEAEEQLSGAVGERQEGTNHVNVHPGNYINATKAVTPLYVDKYSDEVGPYLTIGGTTSSVNEPKWYTARPVNMAVLYCIKATVSEPYEDIYSEEETIVGRWIDGKPIYRKVTEATSGKYESWDSVLTIDNVDLIVSVSGIQHGNESVSGIPVLRNIPNHVFGIRWYQGTIQTYVLNNYFVNCPIDLIVEYTKTTDQGVSA